MNSEMIKFVVALLLLQVDMTLEFSLAEVASRVSRESVADNGYPLICTQTPLELGIVFASPKNKVQFDNAIKFIQEFLRHFDISSDPNGVRVSMVTYGKRTYPWLTFNLTQYKTIDEVIERLGNFPHKTEPYTDTAKAISFMRNDLLTKDTVRSRALKVVIVITERNSESMELTKKEAEEARKDGITMFAIGVGTAIKEQELLNIAGESSRYTDVENFEQLTTLREKLAYQVCFGKMKPRCEPTDVFFVYSPASLGQKATAWISSFISNTLQSRGLDQGFKYGIISGTSSDETGINLNQYDTTDDFMKKVYHIERNKLPELVKILADDGFTEARGARKDSKKVAVIFVGPKKVRDVYAGVDALNAKGIKVIIAVPFGKKVNVPKAIVLNESTDLLQSKQLGAILCP